MCIIWATAITHLIASINFNSAFTQTIACALRFLFFIFLCSFHHLRSQVYYNNIRTLASAPVVVSLVCTWTMLPTTMNQLSPRTGVQFRQVSYSWAKGGDGEDLPGPITTIVVIQGSRLSEVEWANDSLGCYPISIVRATQILELE